MKGKGIVFLSLAAAALFLSVTIKTKSEFSATSQNQTGNLVAGRNVNMVSGTNPITGDPYLQRQNEPSIAVSTVNRANLLAGANDYRTVYMPGLPNDKVPGDAWLGVFKSRDGGESWKSELLPGYLQSNNNPASPLFGFDAAADPTVRAGVDGFFFYSGIAFQRIDMGSSVVFVARYQDFNDVETGDSIRYLDTKIIDRGNTGQFTDKPWIGVDIPRNGHSNVYLLYSIFLGQLDQNIHSKIMFARSTNSGNTWEMPIKISEGQQKNQGTIMAIDPNDGTIYVAWRRFASVNVLDAILIARSTDFGQTFTKAVEVATISRPFDQPTMGTLLGPAQFRTDAFPALAVDSDGRIYLAWTQRDVDSANINDARIIVTSQGKGEWGQVWPPAGPVEKLPTGIRGHQFMPSMTFGAGKLMLAWYDTRYSARYYDEYGNPRSDACSPGLFMTDDANTCPYRETVDVRAAQASPGTSPAFEASTQVSRYLWVLDTSGKKIRQAQFNPANYQLYAGGLWPFHADYLDIAPSPAFVRNASGWRFNRDGDPFLFYVTWTDNRDVRPPQGNIWTTYRPPTTSIPTASLSLNDICDDTGMRNQNIYCSKLTRGIEVGTPINNKACGSERHSFVVYVNNTTDETKSFDLTIINPPPLPGSASFSAESSVVSLSASAPGHSTISRMVFVQSSQPWSGMVQISEVGGDFEGYVQLNLVSGGDTAEGHLPTIINQETINWTAPPGGTILNPNIVNPNIVNPNIVNPNIVNPNIVNPNIVNPNIVNPNIVNPNIVNPNIVNPNIVNSNIPANVNLSGAVIIDKTWTIKNTGSAVTAYTFKNIAGESLPENFYVFAQLLIFKVHRTPAANGCVLGEELHHELLVNIMPPNLSPDITHYNDITNPDVTNDQISNATFSLGPDEEALIILRIIDAGLKPSAKLQKLQATQNFDPAAYANNVGAVVISQAPDPSGNRQVAITFMILPDALPDGLVGKEYHFPLRAIGGTPSYSWSYVTALPPGLFLNAGTGEIYGNPTAGGDYAFTIQVQDGSTPQQSDTQQFLIHIDEKLEIVTEQIPAGIKYQDYGPNNFRFMAKGGLLPYTWSWSGTPPAPPAGLNLDPATGAITGTPTPLQAGNFSITVKVIDKEGPKHQEATKSFDLCILKPIPMNIAPESSILPNAYLGSPYSAIFTAINAEGIPGWQATWVTSQPLGLQVPSSSKAPSIALAGVPLYDKNATNPDYPNTYTLKVSWEDDPTSCEPSRIFERQYNITINPRMQEWASVYEGAGDDEAKALAVDSTGSVYVTGYITNPTTGKDFYTAKYDKNGAVEAAAAYNGPLEDQATAIAVRGSYVYVTGFSAGSTTGADFFTIKYDTSLNKIWQVRYDGPAHLGDFPSALAVDSLGNVYVTGFSYRGQQLKHADYETIKYDSMGKMVWDAAYDDRRNGMDQATAIALLEQGSTVYVYVTGKSQDSVIKDVALLNYDYYTLKYDSLGKVLYQVRTDGPAKGDDEATSLIVDSSGNAYVTGRSKNAAGNYDIFTVKYNSSLAMQGLGFRYDGPFGDDEGAAIAFGPGNTSVYVTGSSRGSGTDVDIYTAKYDSNLNKLFEVRYDGRIGDDKAFALAVDEAGNAYVGGFTARGTGNTDALTLVYDSSLNLSWLARYDSAGKDDQFAALALYKDSTTWKIYLTGFKTGIGTFKDFLTVKY